MEPSKELKEFITKTKVEIRQGIKYTTHYVNRPIKVGDPQGGSIGTCINGIDKTTEVILYEYQPKIAD